MTAYIIRRLVQSVIVFFLITILIFVVMRLLPGDPILHDGIQSSGTNEHGNASG